jgi:hypothetical protein
MLMVLTHPYTWTLTLAITVVYLGIDLVKASRQKIEEKQDIKKILALIISNISFYAIYSMLPFGSNIGATGSNLLSYTSSSPSLYALTNIFNGISNSIELWVGGLFANPLLLLLAIGGMIALKVQVKFDRLLILWVAIPSIVLFAVSPETSIVHRILYLLPFQVLAAIGLNQINGRIDAFINQKEDRSIKILKIVVTLLVLIFLANYALRSVDSAPLKFT